MRSSRTGLLRVAAALAMSCLVASAGSCAMRFARYYGHDTVEDKYGVIAPWYTGLNGQCDMRVRIAMETIKRYPWTPPGKAPAEYPEFLWNGKWNLSPEGVITIPELNDWDNGDMVQRASFFMMAMTVYYRYTGDPAAVAQLKWAADFALDYCLTDDAHPWPRFPISVPVKGKPYGKADPRGFIQLDQCAELGSAVLKAYQIVGDARYLEAAKHWGDLLAKNRNTTPGADPWGRYAIPEGTPWTNKMTGSVCYLLYFFDELIRLGYTGENDSIVKARDAGRAYLKDVLLPKWTESDTFGRLFWDFECGVQCSAVTECVTRYMMDNKGLFPNWRNDARNILALYLSHTSVNPASNSDTFSGAWAYPESSACCLRSLWYSPMHHAIVFSQLGVEADNEWARELARRIQILATYDVHENGKSEDKIDGGWFVNEIWFKIAHPTAIKHVLETIAWLPETLGANRENHIVRSTAIVNSVVYGKGKISYTTFDAPANTVDVLRLSFAPMSVRADGKPLQAKSGLKANGYTVKTLANSDRIVSIRHDGATKIVILGNDPQQVADDRELTYEGNWLPCAHTSDHSGNSRVAGQPGASASFTFVGNQVRLIGRASADGGKADVYVDGVKQLAGIDFWNPSTRHQQVLYYKNGLAGGKHTLKIVATGSKNPYSKGTNVYVDQVQWSNATSNAGYGEGGGPKDTQRMIFGYTSREDFVDSRGKQWIPGMEVLTRLGDQVDSVANTWWTQAATGEITGTDDPELYRYGIHCTEFVVNVTVGPGTYHARLKFAATRGLDPLANCVTVFVNGQQVVSKMNVEATAGGPNKAVDLVFNNISPRNGIIDMRFVGGDAANNVVGEAFVQAIEVGPGDGGQGAKPVCVGEKGQ